MGGDEGPRATALRRARRDAQRRLARPSRPRRRSGARRRRRSAAPWPTAAVAARPPPPPQPCGSGRGLRHCRGSPFGHQGGHRGRHRRHPAVTPPPRPRTPRGPPSPPPPFSRGRRRYRGHDRRRGPGHRGHLRHGLATAAAAVAAVPSIVAASGTTTPPRPPPPPPLSSPPPPPPPPPPAPRSPLRPTCGRRGKGWADPRRPSRPLTAAGGVHLGPQRYLWSDLPCYRPPTTNHTAGKAGEHEENNEEIFVIQCKASKKTPLERRNAVSVRVSR